MNNRQTVSPVKLFVKSQMNYSESIHDKNVLAGDSSNDTVAWFIFAEFRYAKQS